MTLEADEYNFNASEVEQILKVWGEWIHECIIVSIGSMFLEKLHNDKL